MQDQFGYATFGLGMITGWYGIGGIIGFGYLVKKTVHLMKIENYCALGLFLNGIFIILIALLRNEIGVWATVMVIALVNAPAYSSALTNVSNSVHNDRQGWGMGIAVSAVALSFVAAGAMMTLLNVLGYTGLLLLSGIAILFAFLIMVYFSLICQKKV